MTCRDLTNFILAYIEGTLPPQVRARFEQHLAKCPACVDYLENYRSAIALGRRAFEDDDLPVEDAGVPDSLVRGILYSFMANRAAP